MKALGEKGQVAVIRGILGVATHEDRLAGFLAAIGKAPGIHTEDVEQAKKHGGKGFTAARYDIAMFCRMLAKIAHAYAFAECGAEDFSNYRGLQFGMNLAAAAKQAGMKPSEARVVHQRPAAGSWIQRKPRLTGNDESSLPRRSSARTAWPSQRPASARRPGAGSW